MSDFIADGRPWFNGTQAAIYTGHLDESADAETRKRQMRAFYSWASAHRVHMRPGRNVYARRDLDAAINHEPLSRDMRLVRAAEEGRALARR